MLKWLRLQIEKKFIISTYCTNSLFHIAYASYSQEFEPEVLSSEVLKNFFLIVKKSKPFCSCHNGI